MYTKFALALALLPELLAARSAGNAYARRGVDCSFAIAANPGDSCDSFAESWAITVNKLKSLNPGLDCSNLDGDKEYCVMGEVNIDEPTTTSTTSTVVQTTSTATETTQPSITTTPTNDPEPIQPGLAENCDTFHKVVDSDNCDDIVAMAGISPTQFSQWNPYINDSMSLLSL